MTVTQTKNIEAHLLNVRNCTACPNMIGPVVTPTPVVSKVYLCGQAPGPHEGRLGKPFAWTAGKTLFRWFDTIGIAEDHFRQTAYMAAICRCFPGKTKQGGDRVPSREEVAACSLWMEREFELLSPELVIPVGKLAIEQFLPIAPLTDSIGKQFRIQKWGADFDLIPLPHPSGASTWFKREPGKGLLTEALALIDAHPAWRKLKASL
jgi:uracil-DNA glycosylase